MTINQPPKSPVNKWHGQWHWLTLGMVIGTVLFFNFKEVIADRQATAASIAFEKGESGMSSDNVQDAIDEMVDQLYEVKDVANNIADYFDSHNCPTNMGNIEHFKNVCIDKTYVTNGGSTAVSTFQEAHNFCVGGGKRLCSIDELYAAYQQAYLITDQALPVNDLGTQWSNTIIHDGYVVIMNKNAKASYTNFTGATTNRIRCCEVK